MSGVLQRGAPLAGARADGAGPGGFLRREWCPLALFAGFAAVPFLAAATGDAHLVSLTTRVMIFALAALSLDFILGYGALVSFGHAAFLGIGAYAVGILSAGGTRELLVQVPVAMLASIGFALVTGAISLRTRGVYFIMITLAFGQMAFFLAVSLAAYGGDDGLTLSGRSLLLGFDVLRSDTALFALVFLVLASVYLAARLVVGSRFGRVVSGARENAQRLQAVGIAPFPYQLVAYVMAGAVAGLAGALLANQAEFVSPAYMTWQRSGELIIMVILGGLASLHGAILGAAAFLLLEEWLSGLTEHWKMIFGPLLVLIVLFARGGLLGLIRRVRGHG